MVLRPGHRVLCTGAVFPDERLGQRPGHGPRFLCAFDRGIHYLAAKGRAAGHDSAPQLVGLVLVAIGACQLIVATLGVELFLSRTALSSPWPVMVSTPGGTQILEEAGLPLFLLLFMVPIPAILYSRITFPLQLLASRLRAMR